MLSKTLNGNSDLSIVLNAPSSKERFAESQNVDLGLPIMKWYRF